MSNCKNIENVPTENSFRCDCGFTNGICYNHQKDFYNGDVLKLKSENAALKEANERLQDRIINFKIIVGAAWEYFPEDVKKHWANLQI